MSATRSRLSGPSLPSLTTSRRRLLLGGMGAVVLSGLSACGGDDSSSGETDQTAAGWTYTDDRDRTITLDQRPERIVAQVNVAGALWDFGIRPVGVFGPATLPDGSPDPQVGNVDIDQVESLGNVWGEFDVERFASLEPDLLVSIMYVEDTLWYVPDEVVNEVEALTQTAGLRMIGISAPEAIDKVARLAEALGADLSSEENTAARERFEAACDRIRSLAQEKAGLRIMAISGTNDNFYVAYRELHPDLRHLSELGLDIVLAEPPNPEADFFEALSWENANQYEADVIIWDARTGNLTPEELDSIPTWRELPAVQAGQLLPWHASPIYSYLSYAQVLEELADGLSGFRTDIV